MGTAATGDTEHFIKFGVEGIAGFAGQPFRRLKITGMLRQRAAAGAGRRYVYAVACMVQQSQCRLQCPALLRCTGTAEEQADAAATAFCWRGLLARRGRRPGSAQCTGHFMQPVHPAQRG